MSAGKIQIPLLPLPHYKLEVAANIARSKIENFTAENIMQFAAAGYCELFTPVPSELKIFLVELGNGFDSNDCYFHGTQADFPDMMILDKKHCTLIEANGKTHQSDFQAGCKYVNGFHSKLYPCAEGFIWRAMGESRQIATREPVKSIPYHHKNDIESNGSELKLIDPIVLHGEDRGYQGENVRIIKKSIELNKKNILISHESLMYLINKIDFEMKQNEAKNKPQVILPIITDTEPSAYYSLVNKASKIPSCEPVDLLRRAIRRGIQLLALVPEGVKVHSNTCFDIYSGCDYQIKPQILALSDSDCKHIYDRAEVNICDFYQGYIVDDLRLKLVLPTDERPWLSTQGVAWRTFKDNNPINLKLAANNLYVNKSDLEKLSAPETWSINYQDFEKFSMRINDYLLSKDFPSLDEAVEIAKRTYPKITSGHLLNFGIDGHLRILTPVPLRNNLFPFINEKSNFLREENINRPEITTIFPDLLELSKDDCLDIYFNEEISQTDFNKGYRFEEFNYPEIRLVGNEISDSGFKIISYKWQNSYHGDIEPLKISLDNIFIIRSELDLLISNLKKPLQLAKGKFNKVNVNSRLLKSVIYEYRPIRNIVLTPQIFDISEQLKILLEENGFYSISEAAKIKKLTEYKIVELGLIGSLNFITPVPNGLYPYPVNEELKEWNMRRKITPFFLALDDIDCDKLKSNITHKCKDFKNGYDIQSGEYISAFMDDIENEPTGVWRTLCGKSSDKKIDLNFDNVYVKISDLIVNEISVDLSDDTSMASNFIKDEVGFDGVIHPDQIFKTDVRVDELAESTTVEYYNMHQVEELTEYTRSSINAKTSVGNSQYDVNFPKKYYLTDKPKKIGFKKNEVDEWVASRKLQYRGSV